MHERLSFYPERFIWCARSVRIEVQVFMAMAVDSFKQLETVAWVSSEVSMKPVPCKGYGVDRIRDTVTHVDALGLL